MSKNNKHDEKQTELNNEEKIENLEKNDVENENSDVAEENISKEQEAMKKMEEIAKKFIEMQNKVEETENRLQVSINQNIRLQADFDNFRRRTRENEEKINEKIEMKVLKQFLSIVDNCELALNHMRKDSEATAYLEGYELLYKQLLKVLSDFGVSEIEASEKPFDPHFHEAVMQITSDKLDSDHVAGVFQKGYMYKDKVLRPSKVQVVQND